jgi:hypothetical protein
MGHNNYLFPRHASDALVTPVLTKFTQFQRCNSTAITAELLKNKAAAEHLATQGGEDHSQEYSTRKGTQPGIETLSRGVALSTSHDAVQYRPIFTVAMQHAIQTYKVRGGKTRRRLYLCIRNVARYGRIKAVNSSGIHLD